MRQGRKYITLIKGAKYQGPHNNIEKAKWWWIFPPQATCARIGFDHFQQENGQQEILKILLKVRLQFGGIILSKCCS